MIESTDKRIVCNAILNAFRLSLMVIVPLITFPYTSRIFLAEGTGIIEWVRSTISIFTLIAQLGIYTYAVREGVKVRQNKIDFSKFAHELLIINCCATILSYLLLFLCIKFISKFYQYNILLFIYSINIIMSSMGLDWVYGVYEEYRYITIRQIITQIFSLIALFLFVKDIDDMIIYLLINTISSSGANIFNIINSRKYIYYKFQGNYSIKKHLKPILIFFATKFSANAYNYLDNVMLGLLSYERSVGFYSAGSKFNSIIITFFTAMGQVYLPKLVFILEKNDIAHFSKFMKKVASSKLMIAIPMTVGLICLSKECLRLIAGEDFLQASVTLKILSVVFLIVVCSNILQNDVLVPFAKEHLVFKITIIGASCNFLINILLIPIFSEIIAFFVGINEVKKLNINIFCGAFKQIRQYILSSLAIVLVCSICKYFITNYILVLLISIPISILIYCSILFILKDESFLFFLNFVIDGIKKRVL